MNRYQLLAAAVVALAAAWPSTSEAASPVQNKIARHKASYTPWHGSYYDPAWGQPVALVVPPTAGRQTVWSWGVTNTEVVPIWHQFGRSWPGPYYGGGAGFYPTPNVPSSTTQFGVYYVRGPW